MNLKIGARTVYQYITKNYSRILIVILFLSTLFIASLYSDNNRKYIDAYFIYLQGLNYERNNDISAALKYYKKSIDKYNSFPEPYFRIGLLYKNRTELEKSKYYFEKAEKYMSQFRNKIDLANFLKEFGDACYNLKEYDKAIKYYTKLTNIRKDYNIIYKIGELYYLKKNYTQSENYLDMYIDFCFNNEKNSYNIEDLKQALKLIVNIDMDKEKYTKALKHLKELYSLTLDKEIKNKISILSNNLQYYDEK